MGRSGEPTLESKFLSYSVAFVSFRSWWVILREAGYLFPPAHPLVNFHVGAHPPRPFPDGRTLWTPQEEY